MLLIQWPLLSLHLSLLVTLTQVSALSSHLLETLFNLVSPKLQTLIFLPPILVAPSQSSLLVLLFLLDLVMLLCFRTQALDLFLMFIHCHN